MENREAIEIKTLGLEDGAALARLAELDTAKVPPAPVLGGIVAGRLVAARSLATGEAIADPFRHTAEVRSLLTERAGQLRRSGGSGFLDRLRRQLPGRALTRPASEALR
jgi:hypothetical protein